MQWGHKFYGRNQPLSTITVNRTKNLLLQRSGEFKEVGENLGGICGGK